MLTDKERILTTLVRSLYGASILKGPERVHFDLHADPAPGDLVMATTGFHPNEFTIAFYVSLTSKDHGIHVVRDINTGQLCDYSNETFVPIRNMQYTDLLTGDRRAFYHKVLKACYECDEFLFRFGGLLFENNTAHITVRKQYTQPVERTTVSMPWSKRTSIKAIIKVIKGAKF